MDFILILLQEIAQPVIPPVKNVFILEHQIYVQPVKM
jgi:hypothetical protein